MILVIGGHCQENSGFITGLSYRTGVWYNIKHNAQLVLQFDLNHCFTWPLISKILSSKRFNKGSPFLINN